MAKKQNMIARFFKYYKPHKTLFIIDMLCAFCVSAFTLVYPFLTKEIINNYVPNKLINMLLAAAGALLAFYVIKAAMYYFMTCWGHIVGVRIQSDLRREMFTHLQKLPFSYFDDNKTGVIMSRMTNDLFQISELAHHGPEDVFLSFVTLIGAFIMLAFINVYLALIVFAFVPLFLLVVIPIRRKMTAVYKQTRVTMGEVNADIESAISGMRVSRAYTASAHETQKFEAGNAAFVEARVKQFKLLGKFHSAMTFFIDFMYFSVLLGGGLFFYYGLIDVGDFTAFALYISALISPIRTLVTIYDQIQEGATGFARFCEIMDEQPEPETATDPDCPQRFSGEIEFKNVTFGYKNSDDDSAKVITDFSLVIPAGKTVALVGPSGGGKTTLCHLIPRFYEIDAGSITVDGRDIRNISRYTLRKNIGIVQQDVYLFNGTVRENIAYGDFDASEQRIIDAAKKANIHDYVMSLPRGYDTCVGERGVKLSGGQKQRISIARAFLKDPPILILDEATSALDNATEMLIQDALFSLSKGRTTLVVAHRLSTVKNADEIIVITENGVTERGTHEQLIAADGLYKKLYDYQFKNL